jgi:hypothetical protein
MRWGERLIAVAPGTLLTALLGVAFAIGLYGIWGLATRWFVVVVAGTILLSASMIFLGHAGQLLFYAFLFAIPIASIEKWLFWGWVPPDQVGSAVFSGLIGIGPIDFILAGLYLSWMFRIFVTREAPLLRFEKIDALVLLLPVSYVISLWGAPRIMFGVHAIGYLLKHLLAYFYVSRHVQRHHLRWIVVALLAAITLEAGLSVVQTQAGALRGLARDKGAQSSERQSQYVVPGLEEKSRAEGTLYDSHALGCYFVLLLPLPFILMNTSSASGRARAACAAVLVFGCIGLVLTYSRSAWIGFAVSMLLAFGVVCATARGRMLRRAIGSLIALGLLAPWAFGYLWERFARAPSEIISARFEGYAVALPVWFDHFLFGYGVANYLEAVKIYSFNWARELPVHNVFLWIATETGLLGLVVFYGLILAAMFRFWRLFRARLGLISDLSFALAIGLVAYCVDGLAEPLYREPVVYMMFWLTIALSVGMTRLAGEKDGAALAAQPA